MPAMPAAEIEIRSRIDQLLEIDPCDRLGFLGAQYDLGLAWVHFPEGSGGLDADRNLQGLVHDSVVAAAGPQPRYDIGYGMAAPTIVTCGTPEQHRRWLRPLFTGEEIWCQLFSEPGAGSDVAGLSTRAVADGDEWVVNGQKVWTSNAHLARWGLLVTRTDPDAPKHRGLTYFAIDLNQSGVEIRPLRQLTGQAEFNEIYLTDARVAEADRLGDVGDGWRVTLTTLMNERVAIGGETRSSDKGTIDWVFEAWRDYGHDDPARRDDLMRLWVRSETLRLNNMRAEQSRETGTPGPEGSIGKVLSAELNKDAFAFALGLSGMAGTLFDAGYEQDQTRPALDYDSLGEYFLRVRANSIEGGTTEVMRNILGERVLGLPGDVRVDKDVPWIEVPRS
ncbi:MAG: acyl-CoA dehydrogenase family protein [Acidimicrobiales bacterium]|jgi:alkylation response protein AidB-like acyl-CoA dehydrogenase|nr:acyl-CoA dehydrogenase family protein [Acidimicrobiales bacterium]MDP6911298.1 acyl-CoA dehydrogenase family protein [Acidimicrobiales bacterium]